MVDIDNDLLKAFQSADCEWDIKVIINSTVTLTSENILSCSLKEQMTSGDTLSLGGTPSRCLTIKLIMPEDTSSLNLEKCIIQLFVGAKVNDTVEYISMGYFYEDSLETTDKNETVTVTAYDSMLKIDDLGDTYTCALTDTTVYPDEIINDICTQAGISFDRLPTSTTYYYKETPVSIKYNKDGSIIREDVPSGYMGTELFLLKGFDPIDTTIDFTINCESFMAPMMVCFYDDMAGTSFISSQNIKYIDEQEYETSIEGTGTISITSDLDFTKGVYMGVSISADNVNYFSFSLRANNNKNTNLSTEIKNPYSSGISARTMLSYMAGVVGGHSYISRDNKLCVNSFEYNSIEISKDNILQDGITTKSTKVLEPRYIVTGNSDNVITYGTGDFGYNFENPYISTSELAQNCISVGYNSKMSVYNGELKTFFNPSVELGDVIHFKDEYDDTIYMLVTGITTDFDGLSTTISCDISSESSETVFSSPNTKTLAQYNSDLKQTYDEIIKTLTGVTGGYVKNVYDSNSACRAIAITQSDVDVEWDETNKKVITSDGSNVPMWVWSLGGLSFSSNGGTSYSTVAVNMKGQIYCTQIMVGGTMSGFDVKSTYFQSSETDDDGNTYRCQVLTPSATPSSDKHAAFRIQILKSGETDYTTPYYVAYDGSVKMVGTCTIGDDCAIGDDCTIGDSCTIGGQLSVGSNSSFGDSATFDGSIRIDDSSRPRIFLRTSSGSTLTNRLQIYYSDGTCYIASSADTFSISTPTVGGLSGTGNRAVYADSNGKLTMSSSSKKYKENITEISEEYDPSGLYDVPVVQYNYKEEYKNMEPVEGTQIGMIAEDVEKHFSNAVIYDKEGNVENWHERIMIPALLKLIQDQKKEIDDLKDRVEQLENK